MFKKKKFKLDNNISIFLDRYLIYSNIHVCIYVFFFFWFFEWAFIMQYTWNFWSYARIFYPHKLPGALMILFFYWIYVWGISVWRRALHGRFTRGDRRLWFKGFASFWFTELSTIIGIYIAACWMNWGPVPLMPRYFLMQKKGFLVEMSLFTHVIWLLYLMRYGLKIYLWRTQAGITSVIIFILSCLLWRDFSTLYSRDVINLQLGSKWKYIKLNMVIYSLSAHWWTQHYMGEGVDSYGLFHSFDYLYKNNFYTSPFTYKMIMTEYQSYHWIPLVLVDNFNTTAFPFIKDVPTINNLRIKSITHDNWIEFIDNVVFLDTNKFYPRKIGFYPKKIAMWYFLVVLKIWHHLMLFIWWVFYLFRLESTKKNSYSLLSSCYFNLYCCIIICILVYCFHFLPIWERSLKIRFPVREYLFNVATIVRAGDYCASLFTYHYSLWGGEPLLKLMFYRNINFFVNNFNSIFFSKGKFMVDDSFLHFVWMFGNTSNEGISRFLHIKFNN